MTTQLDDLLGAIAGAPDFGADAACKGRSAVFDDVDMPGDALAICAGCSAIEACNAWAQSQRRNALHGVIGGTVYVWTQPQARGRNDKPQLAKELAR